LVILLGPTSIALAQFTLLNQFANGAANSPGYLQYPIDVGNVGPDGQVLVDQGQLGTDGIVKAYSADGSFVQTLANGPVGSEVSFNQPGYSAIGADGTYYVSDFLHQTVVVAGTTGVANHYLPSVAAFSDPAGVAASAAGTLYVADKDHIDVYGTIFNGTSYPSLGSFGSAGSGAGQFGAFGIGAITLDSTGANLYVADGGNNRIDVFSSAGAYESSIGNLSGPGQLTFPTGVGVSGTGLVFVADDDPGIKVFSSGGAYQETVAATVNGQSFHAVSVSVAPTGLVYIAGQFSGGGSLGAFRYFDPASWASGTNTFTNPTTGPTSVAVGTGRLLGTNLTLDATKGLVVGQTTTVNNGGSLTLAGGTLNTGSLTVDGTASNANFTMTGGSLTTDAITVSNGGIADFVGQPLSVALGGTVSVADANSQFKVEQGATFSATGLTNHGQVTVGSNADFIVFNPVVNQATVNLNGGELDIRGLLGNAPGSTIQGTGTLNTSSGLSNSGSVQLTGQASIFGTVNNLATGGTIEVSGAQSHTFFGGVVNDGTFTIDAGSSAAFQGGYAGPNGTAGTGTATFAGGLSPGVPTDMAFGGSVALQHANVTTLQLAGTTAGSGYDKIDVAGQLSFDGTLLVALQSFTPQVGEVFHLFSWGSEVGTFSQLSLPALPTGLSWNAAQLYTQGNLRVTISGDVNADGVVNGLDINQIATKWLATGTGIAGDANNDGVINGLDINAVASNWLHTAGGGTEVGAAVPEPTSFMIAALAGLALLAHGRR
jgi:hypothetical protein